MSKPKKAPLTTTITLKIPRWMINEMIDNAIQELREDEPAYYQLSAQQVKKSVSNELLEEAIVEWVGDAAKNIDAASVTEWIGYDQIVPNKLLTAIKSSMHNKMNELKKLEQQKEKRENEQRIRDAMRLLSHNGYKITKNG